MITMYDEIIELISISKEKNQYGDILESEKGKKVFAEIESIGRAEFYQAQARGFKPEVKIKIPDYLDYSGEQKIKCAQYGKAMETYQVIRTYRTGNELEIICKRGID